MTERSESERAEEDRIDRLRLAAFKSNDASDRQSYFDAASKWFQDRHYRRLAAQDQKPVAWLQSSGTKTIVSQQRLDMDASRYGWTGKPLYLSPPPAAGWNEAIEACKKVAEKWLESFMGGEVYVARSIVNAIEALRRNEPPDTGAGKSEPPHWREVEMMRLIDLLRSEEGDSVTILCDNPDVNGQPNCAVVCNGEWTNWQDRRFAQDTLLDALSAAMIEYKRPRDPVALPDHGGADAGVGLRAALSTVENLIRRDPACFNLSDELQPVRTALRESLSKPAPVAADASAEARLREALERIEYGIDIRMNDYLCEMKPDYDDSITGFNEAWDIVRKFLKDKIAALSAHPHASDCDKQKECCDLAAKEPCADCPFPNPDATVRGFTDLERTLLIAAKAGLNYITNTESELGMTLKSGGLLRAAIAKAEACEISAHPHASDCDKRGETDDLPGVRSANDWDKPHIVQDEAAMRADLISLILDMGRVIRSMDEDNLHSEFWSQDGDYIIDSRFPK